nr:hypothetical protein 12 [bacterium]
MAIWTASTDSFEDLFLLFGSFSRNQIDGYNGAPGRNTERIYQLLTGNLPTANVSNMLELDGYGQVDEDTTFTVTTGASSLSASITLDPNKSEGYYNFQVLNKTIGGYSSPPSGDWAGESIPSSTDGDTFAETGYISFGTSPNVISDTLSGLVPGDVYYCKIRYYNGFNSLDEQEYEDTTVLERTPQTIVLNTPQISTFSVNTSTNEFSMSWTANGNSTNDFDEYRVRIVGQFGGSQTFTYSNTTTSVSNIEVTNFFYTPGETITGYIQARDNNNTNSAEDSATDTA